MAHSTICPSRQRLHEFAVGLLPEAEMAVLERHLARCTACLQLLNGLETADQLLDALAAAPAVLGRQDPALEQLKQQLQDLHPAEAAAAPGHPTAVCWSAAQVTPPGPGLPGDAGSGEATLVGYPFLAPAQAADEIGRVRGYRVLQRLGTGGMGVVFLAEQERPRRRVALKMVLAGEGAGRERLARLRAEAEVLARLHHPNIVPVYEVGEQDGYPFFAMEYVDGASLSQRLVLGPLPARGAAGLLETLARAVQAAHAQGFVHRDLKPANVLLAADGTPKIADFGLAKPLGEGLGLSEPGYRTESGAILGTPAYMAPEQASGQLGQVGPAADVYALGAVLYECLTGRPPFKAATVLETLELVRSQEPLPPGRLQPGLPRDLETVALKCLEKDAGRRYASAQALADDLRRFLDGVPIQARPVPAWERTWKWARRRPAAAGLVALSGLAVAGAIGGLWWHTTRLGAQVRRAEAGEQRALRQQERADRNYQQARQALNRMLDRLNDKRLADVPRLAELRQEQLEDALTFYQEVARAEDIPDSAVRKDVAWALMQMGAIQVLLGRSEPAKANFRRAVAVLEGLPEEELTRSQVQGFLVECHTYLGSLAMRTGAGDDMERSYRQAIASCERLAVAEPDEPMWRTKMATAEHDLGTDYLSLRRWAEAEPHLLRAVEIRSRLLRADDEKDPLGGALAGDYNSLGYLYQQLRRPADAVAAFAKAERFLLPLIRAYPEDPNYGLSLAGVYINWTRQLRFAGKELEALERASRAVGLAEAVVQREPRHALARSWAHNAHGERALTCEALGRWAEAVKDWDRVLELSDGPKRLDFRVQRALMLARAVDRDRTLAEATALAEEPGVAGTDLYNLACVFARLVGMARTDARLSTSEQAAAAEGHAVRAVEMLQRLRTSGYFKNAGNRELLKTDIDLASLRPREDFQKLLAQVISGAPGAAPKGKRATS
jgi:serine/threonine-protein kinase